MAERARATTFRAAIVWLGLKLLAGCGSETVTPLPPPPPGWSQLASSPQSRDNIHFMDGFFLTTTEGWVIGFPNLVYSTSDGGTTLLTGAVDLYFFDRNRGIVAGARGVGPNAAAQESSRTVIAMTEDGGDTWVERHVSTATGSWAWKISFPTADVGYVATQGPNPSGLILKTIDGGRTWTELAVAGHTGFEGIGSSRLSAGGPAATTA